jgi:hypothetical protein
MAAFARQAYGAQTFVIGEAGRWVVYLDVALPRSSPEQPIEVVRHRIGDYASERDAEAAASWISRGANRDLPRPPFGL